MCVICACMCVLFQQAIQKGGLKKGKGQKGLKGIGCKRDSRTVDSDGRPSFKGAWGFESGSEEWRRRHEHLQTNRTHEEHREEGKKEKKKDVVMTMTVRRRMMRRMAVIAMGSMGRNDGWDDARG